MEPIKIKAWTDDLNGTCYLEDFLKLRRVDGGEIVEILEEDFEGHHYADLYRDHKIDNPQDDLVYLCIDHKDKEVRLFGCIRGNTIVLVHGIVKPRHTRTPVEEIAVAVERIKRIPINYGS